MAAGRYSFTIEQGSTLDLELNWKDKNNNPIDLTGYEGKLQIRSDFSGSGETYLTLTSSLGDSYNKGKNDSFISFSGSNLSTPLSSGSIGIYAGYELTDNLDFNEAYYDLELTQNQIRTRLIEGKVRLNKQTTD